MKFGIYTLVIEGFMSKFRYDHPELKLVLEFGWGNGYVLLPNDHMFYNIHHDNLDIDIHGGLTWSTKFNSSNFLSSIENLDIGGDVTKDNYEMFNDYWIIGFDTNHYCDNLLNCSKNFVLSETNSLLDKCLDNSIEGIKDYKVNFLRKNRKDKLNSLEYFFPTF